MQRLVFILAILAATLFGLNVGTNHIASADDLCSYSGHPQGTPFEQNKTVDAGICAVMETIDFDNETIVITTGPVPTGGFFTHHDQTVHANAWVGYTNASDAHVAGCNVQFSRREMDLFQGFSILVDGDSCLTTCFPSGDPEGTPVDIGDQIGFLNCGLTEVIDWADHRITIVPGFRHIVGLFGDLQYNSWTGQITPKRVHEDACNSLAPARLSDQFFADFEIRVDINCSRYPVVDLRDFNKDGVVDVQDAVCVLQRLVGLTPNNAACPGNVSTDPSLGLVIRILRFIAGLDQESSPNWEVRYA